MRVALFVLALCGLFLCSEARSLSHRRSFVESLFGNTPATVPRPGDAARKAAVSARKAGFLYGPSLIGNASFFPDGPLGKERVKQDMDLWTIDRNEIDKRVKADAGLVGAAIQANGGLKSLEDYARVLYGNQWKNSNPLGTAPGIMTNYTQDLLFSMERLSQNSYPLYRAKSGDALPFDLPDALVKNITTTTLKALQSSNALFIVDHKNQKAYQKTTVAPQRYGAACTAYFFIHPKSKDFLPLAIKTNEGSDLIYTPMDSPTDWLLAKMIFNVNDMFHAQMFHLTVTHDVSEGLHLAALRTLSSNHPVMQILERLMLQGYSSRPVGEELCFNPGGHWDQLFFVNNVGCRQYVTESWPVQGSYEKSYLLTDLRARGLIDKSNNFPFKTFPFFQDAIVIRDAYYAFFDSFVNSYYPSTAAITADYELQAWFLEVSQGAKVHGFPQCGISGTPCTRKQLTEVLTHFGFIVSVVHHSLNGGDPVGSKATLPFHLNALFAPLPTAKGVTNLLPFLPPPPNAVHYIGFLATFNRPFYSSTNRTMLSTFDKDLLSNLNTATNTAAKTFITKMQKLSTQIKARTFKNGLSLGMPFIYRTLDPGYIPFFSCV